VVIFMKFPYNVQGYIVHVECAIILQSSLKLKPLRKGEWDSQTQLVKVL
jgi:hypothetical protein